MAEIIEGEEAYHLLFFASVVLGFMIGLYYECFRFLRIAFPHPAFLVAIEDLLFFLPLGPLLIFFHYALTDGMIRWFSVAGSLAGFLLYLGTLGRLLSLMARRILRAVKRILAFLYALFLRPVVNVFKNITNYLLLQAKNLAIIGIEKHRKQSLIRKGKRLVRRAENGFIH